MTDFLTRLAARTLGIGTRVAPDVAPEIAGALASIPPAALDASSSPTGTSPSRATVQELPSPTSSASTGRSPREMKTNGAAMEAPDTETLARNRLQRRSARAEVGSGSNDRAISNAARTPITQFIPLVKQNVVTAPIQPLDRGQEGIASHAQPAPFAQPAQRVAKSPEPAAFDESDNVADAPNPRHRNVLFFAEPASNHATGERTSAAESAPREPTTVRVTIGRVEVRAAAAMARAEPTRKALTPRRGMSLDAYLKQRNESRS